MVPQRAPSWSLSDVADIRLVLFDVGGVLGTNGWDHEQRIAAVARFGLDADVLEARHHEVSAPWEEGRITMRDYLDHTVFNTPRSFSRDEFANFMFAQSLVNPDAVALARRIRAASAVRMMTLNNESAELNQYRIRAFGLAPLFDAFLSSCYVGARKPLPDFYTRTFGIARVDPAHTVFIDDRDANLVPARALGVHTVLWTDAQNAAKQLAELGLPIAEPATEPTAASLPSPL